METDTYLLRAIPEDIYQYDYVGCKWPWDKEQPGGAGLTLRRRSVMLRICDECSDEVEKTPMQDNFASNGVKRLGLKTPSYEEGGNYFIEAHYSVNPVGVHQWWTYIAQLKDTDCLLPIVLYTTLDIA